MITNGLNLTVIMKLVFGLFMVSVTVTIYARPTDVYQSPVNAVASAIKAEQYHGPFNETHGELLDELLSELKIELQIEQSTLEKISQHRQWHHLLHYRQHPLSVRQRYRSQNDDPNFFLHRDGHTNPLLELLASLSAFLLPVISNNSAIDVSDNNIQDNHAQCRFPARFYWLATELPILWQHAIECPQFQKWQHTLAAHSLTLIFPSSHINSPSSMYGHTLLRVDKADPYASKLLSYSVNFAAHHDPSDNEFVFSYKGLTGGYPGKLSVEPYYNKTNQYQKMEYRDTWEYPLNFNSNEVDQFIRHVWELKDSFFDYYFFDENCSYRLLAILDASSERSNLADLFKLKALPVDTIRALQKHGFVDGNYYRPSAATDMEWAASQVIPRVNDQARSLVDHTLAIDQQSAINYQAIITEHSLNLNTQQKAQMLELSVAYARYLTIKKRRNHSRLRPLTLAMLSARSQLPRDTQIAGTPLPNYRDDQGHASQRVKTAVVYMDRPNLNSGEDSTASAIDITLRPAFHAVTDPVTGFIPGSQIEMGQVQLRLGQSQNNPSDYRIQLQQLTLVDVLSLTPHTHYQSPISWGVRASLARQLSDQGLYGQLGFRFGRTWRYQGQQLFTMWHSEVLLDNQFKDGFKVQLGPDLGWLYQGQRWQAMAQFSWRPVTSDDLFTEGDGRSQHHSRIFFGYRLLASSQIGFDYQYQSVAGEAARQQSAQQTQQWRLQLSHYF